MEVVVTGIGLVTALGQSTTESWKHLVSGYSGIKQYTLYPEHPDLLLGLIEEKPQSIRSLLEIVLPEAMDDAGMQQLPSRTGVVIGSSRGNQAEIESLARHSEPLNNWLQLYQSSPSSIATQILQTQGPVLVPRSACATGLWAIAQGADLIRHQLADVVIAGGAEAPITPLTIAGFQKMGALSNQAATPFDRDRSGFVLGEGAAIFVLESRDRARQRNHKPYGNVLGFGSSADGFHVSAPNPDATVAFQAVQQCFERSNIVGKSIDIVHTHGTGTRLNDVNESKIINRLCAHRPYCTSSKGALGHTLGASGAIGSAICLLSLRDGVLPACTGLTTLDPDCNINLLTQSHRQAFQTALCLSFGFGGQNAAIAFTKSDHK